MKILNWFKTRSKLVKTIEEQNQLLDKQNKAMDMLYETMFFLKDKYYLLDIERITTIQALVLKCGGEIEIDKEIIEAVLNTVYDVKTSQTDKQSVILKLVERPNEQ